MTYDDRYKGCPGCGEYEDRDCRCTGEAYEGGGFVEILRSRSEIRCTCGATWPRGWQHAQGCPFYPVQVIFLSHPFDFADWGDRGLIRYQDRRPSTEGRHRRG